MSDENAETLDTVVGKTLNKMAEDILSDEIETIVTFSIKRDGTTQVQVLGNIPGDPIDFTIRASLHSLCCLSGLTKVNELLEEYRELAKLENIDIN